MIGIVLMYMGLGALPHDVLVFLFAAVFVFVVYATPVVLIGGLLYFLFGNLPRTNKLFR